MIRYEWTVEETDEVGDVISTAAYDTYAQAARACTTPTESIVLVRTQISAFGDVIDRQWADIENNEFPVVFDGGARVPKCYYREFVRGTTNGTD